jgi:hypothetical protein
MVVLLPWFWDGKATPTGKRCCVTKTLQPRGGRTVATIGPIGGRAGEEIERESHSGDSVVGEIDAAKGRLRAKANRRHHRRPRRLPASSVHPRLRTPWISQIVIGAGMAIIAALMPIEILGKLAGAGTLSAFILVCAAVIYLRRAEPDVARPFRVPLVPWLPLTGILACLGLLAGLGAYTWLRLAGWIAIGLAIYFIYGRFHSRLSIGLVSRRL